MSGYHGLVFWSARIAVTIIYVTFSLILNPAEVLCSCSQMSFNFTVLNYFANVVILLFSFLSFFTGLFNSTDPSTNPHVNPLVTTSTVKTDSLLSLSVFSSIIYPCKILSSYDIGTLSPKEPSEKAFN